MSTEAFRYVLRILKRVYRIDGRRTGSSVSFDALLAECQSTRLNGVISVETAGARLGHLVFSEGELAYVQYVELDALDALQALRDEFPQSHYGVHQLEPAGLTLLSASLGGQVALLGEAVMVKEPELRAELKAAGYNGVLAFEVGLNLIIWEVASGDIEGPSLPPGEVRCRMTRLDWDGRPLTPLATGLPATPEPQPIQAVQPREDLEALWSAAESVLTEQMGVGGLRVAEGLKTRFSRASLSEALDAVRKQLAPFGPSVTRRFEEYWRERRGKPS